jgi:hypothetical protein
VAIWLWGGGHQVILGPRGWVRLAASSLLALSVHKLMTRDAIVQEDLMKAVRKLNDAKKHETSA